MSARKLEKKEVSSSKEVNWATLEKPKSKTVRDDDVAEPKRSSEREKGKKRREEKLPIKLLKLLSVKLDLWYTQAFRQFRNFN